MRPTAAGDLAAAHPASYLGSRPWAYLPETDALVEAALKPMSDGAIIVFDRMLTRRLTLDGHQ